ncbi:AzlC family ABC transporter permease [Chitinibacter fontanus]|uniref:AzlC family ABC transporter permease n=1 Tax=Chitinibacter fontanus TaxID=1737446 RepID=A0A7D5Z457_9NEIS|nr:AzlC family ABC transporter permease [Chitinibacter fontanus]QLI80342.1 AzlC family ABC transporter permease [Chitinibacter fontanus]
MTTLTNPHSARAALKQGFVATLPMQLGVAPFGLIFGTLAAPSGLPPWAALAMSIFVYAGSAQFLALTLLAASASWPVIVLTTLVVNLRHALYSATLQSPLSHLPFWQRAGLAYFLTDETFAAVQSGINQNVMPISAYMLGSGLCNCCCWVLCTALGIALGQAVPQIAHWGLEFAMVATFTGIVVPMLVSRAQVFAALAAAITALLAASLPYKLGLICAVIVGVSAGMLVARFAAPPHSVAD